MVDVASLKVIPFRGAELTPHIEALGHLRIQVFKEFPYLYEGDIGFERDYLSRYADSFTSLVILVFDGEQLVGATTCLPLKDELPEFREPFALQGYPIDKICYFGESILLPEYRRHGLGRQFFQYREAHARELGLEQCTFCAVDRPLNHPCQPANYRSLHEFWTGLGYERQTSLVAQFAWKEVGQTEETPHTLTFWIKTLKSLVN